MACLNLEFQLSPCLQTSILFLCEIFSQKAHYKMGPMKCKQGKEQKRVELFAKSVRAFDQQLPLMLHHKFPSSTSIIDGSDGEANS